MTISSTWSTDINNQRAFIEELLQTQKSIDTTSSIISVHGSSAPSTSDLLTKWSQTFDVDPQVGSLLNWFNPNTGKVEQIYVPQGGVPVPYKPKPTAINFELIAEQTVGTAAAIDINNIPQTHRHLWIQYSVRSTGAGTTGIIMSIRINNLATNIYDQITLLTLNASAPLGSVTAASAHGYAGAIPTDGLPSSVVAAGLIWIPNYSLTALSRRVTISQNVFYAGASRPYTKYIIFGKTVANTTPAVTRLTFQGTSGETLQRGSRIRIYGLS